LFTCKNEISAGIGLKRLKTPKKDGKSEKPVIFVIHVSANILLTVFHIISLKKSDYNLITDDYT
jgi:hypothetical protein